MRAPPAAASEPRLRRTVVRVGAALATFAALSAGLAAAALPALARAQPPSIRGTVVDSAGRPLDDAEVTAGQLATTRTDAAGHFALPPRDYAFPLALDVRRVGFAAQSVIVTAPDTALRIVLRAAGQTLDTVRVVDARHPALVAAGFYDRQRKTHGRHLDSLALRQYASAGLVGALRETSRLSILRRGNDDYAYTSVSGRLCRMNVFVDGRFERAAQPGTIDKHEGVGLRELVPFDAILAIEVYPTTGSVPTRFQRVGTAAGDPRKRGGAQIPSSIPMKVGNGPVGGTSHESGDAACGAIVIWTKDGAERAPGGG